MTCRPFDYNKLLICAREFSFAGPFLEPKALSRTLRLCLLCLQMDRAEHKGELQTDKMMRAAAKDVHRLRGQSCKEPPEVQSFR